MKYLHLVVSHILIAIAPNSSLAATFTFFQGGYSEGAFVSGSFEGSDSNDDGSILYEAFQIGPLGELTDFSLSFSGNSTVSPFSLSFGDLFQFRWNTKDGILEGEPTALAQLERIEADRGTPAGFVRSGGSLSNCNGVNFCGTVVGPNGHQDNTVLPVQISSVPLPASGMLLALGLGGFVYLRRTATRRNYALV